MNANVSELCCSSVELCSFFSIDSTLPGSELALSLPVDCLTLNIFLNSIKVMRQWDLTFRKSVQCQAGLSREAQCKLIAK